MEANLWLRFFRDAWVEPAPKITNLQHIRDFLCVWSPWFHGEIILISAFPCIVEIDKIKKYVSIYSFADQINKVTDGQQHSEMLLKPGEWLLAKRFVVSTAVAKPQNERIWC